MNPGKSVRRSIAMMLMVTCAGMADQIVMKNGDKISGKIVKKDGKTLTIETADFGTVTTDWSKVEAVHADAPLNVVLSDGKTVKGTVTTTGSTAEIAGPGSKQSVPLTEIEALRNDAEQRTFERLLRPRWTDLWAVNGSLSLAGAAGNAKTFTLLVPVTATRITRKDATNVRFGLIRSSATVNGRTESTARAIRSGWAYNRNLHPRVFWNVFNDYEYDQFQNLDLRIVAGSGFGFSVAKTEKHQLDLTAGLAWNREAFAALPPTDAFVRNSFEFYWGNNWLWKLNGRSTLTQSYRMFNTLTGSGNGQSAGFRQNFDFNLTTRMVRWLTWNVAISDRYLQHPIQGRKKNDIVYATGLGFTISR